MRLYCYIFLLSFSALASDHDFGNGGHIVECSGERGKRTFELLDFHEAKKQGVELLDSFRTNADTTLHARLYDELTKTSKIHPLLKYFYMTFIYLKMDRNNDRNYVDREIALVHDYRDIDLSSGCILRQFAAHEDYVREWRETFRISRPYYRKATLMSRFGIWNHEVVYNFLRKAFGHKDSFWTRKIVSSLFQEERLTLSEWKELFSKAGIYKSKTSLIRPLKGKAYKRAFLWKTKGQKFTVNGKSCFYKKYEHSKKLDQNGLIFNIVRIQERGDGQQPKICFKNKVLKYKSSFDTTKSYDRAELVINKVVSGLHGRRVSPEGYSAAAVDFNFKIEYSNEGYLLFPFWNLESDLVDIVPVSSF